MRFYAAVIINRAVQAVNRAFTYKIPVALQNKIVPGLVVKVPFGHEHLEGVVVELLDQSDREDDTLKEIEAIISPNPLFGEDLLQLSQYLADYFLSTRAAFLQAMLPAGLSLTGHLPKSSLVEHFSIKIQEPVKLRSTKQKEIYAYLQQNPDAEKDVILANTNSNLSILRNMVQKEYIEKRTEMRWYQQSLKADIEFIKPECLTIEQKEVLDRLQKNAAAERKPVLLHGVTGSGKTELYLRFLEPLLRQGKQAILLVPEISLTPQMVSYFRSRLQLPVAVLHSGLSAKERKETWLGIAKGIYPLVIGTRSAVFAPTPNLGAIIMDEIHDGSYKQESQPCFHALTAAKERCRLCGAQLLLGSATPPVTLYYQAQQGEYLLLQLKNRVLDLPLPRVQTVDMRLELQKGNRSMFSGVLKKQITDTLTEGKQVILFLNRRGYHTFVSCRSCGEALLCRHCAVAMAYHQEKQVLKCHYCGFTQSVPEICPNCGSKAIRQFGSGTQKVAEEAAKLWPQAHILRLDRDATLQKGSYEQIYKQMYQGEADILIGTQMVVKGLDFPNVTLVGVLAADASLFLPDLFAEEKSFQLLTQVAGRAGRRDLPGQVIIQSYQPEHEIIQAAAAQDYATFYHREIAERQMMQNPPFSFLIRMIVSGLELEKTAFAAQVLHGYLHRHLAAEEQLLGPQEAPLAKIKDRYRMQLMLKGTDLFLLRLHLRNALAEYQKDGKIKKNIRILIDIEPISMM